jgi:hypothetical protein
MAESKRQGALKRAHKCLKGLALRSNGIKALKDIISSVIIRFLVIIPGSVIKMAIKPLNSS